MPFLNFQHDDKSITKTTKGNGPVDAIFNAICEIYPHSAKLELYQVHAVTKGTDAQGEVTVRLMDDNGTEYKGHAADVDTMVASAKAYLSAINKMLTFQAKHGKSVSNQGAA